MGGKPAGERGEQAALLPLAGDAVGEEHGRGCRWAGAAPGCGKPRAVCRGERDVVLSQRSVQWHESIRWTPDRPGRWRSQGDPYISARLQPSCKSLLELQRRLLDESV